MTLTNIDSVMSLSRSVIFSICGYTLTPVFTDLMINLIVD